MDMDSFSVDLFSSNLFLKTLSVLRLVVDSGDDLRDKI